MDTKHQERVQKTLEFIEKDRIIPEDPWFYSRLIARMENEAEVDRANGWFGSLALRLRPVLAVVVVIFGITGGILLGRALSSVTGSPESSVSAYPSGEDAHAALFREVSGTMDEQILLMK